jgi:membrane associated rhomboid family serine protease
MGIYDREYYRGEQGGPSWFGGVAPWCKTLILINCVIFLIQQALRVDPSWMAEWLAASPEGIFRHGRVWQLLTATFLHANLPQHILAFNMLLVWIAFNMLFLWLVGREMESLYGSRDFLAFYLAAAVVSTLGWAAIQAFQPGPRYMLGAAGPVMGVLTLFTLFYPKREILFFFIPMPMWAVLGIFLVFPLLSERERLGLAYQSHLAGALFALAYKQFDLRLSRLVPGPLGRPRLRIFSSVPADQPRSRPAASSWTSSEGHSPRSSSSVSVIPEEQLDARLDDVLAKIAREGRGALTDEERRVLEEASRRARNKRSDRL